MFNFMVDSIQHNSKGLNMTVDILTGSLLSRRPCHLSSSQHVDMKMVNRLSTMFSIINHCRGQRLVNSVWTTLTAGGFFFFFFYRN